MKQQKFYQATWFICLSLILFAPIGILILWTSKRFKPRTNKILTGIFGIWFCIVMASYLGAEDSKNFTANSQNLAENKQDVETYKNNNNDNAKDSNGMIHDKSRVIESNSEENINPLKDVKETIEVHYIDVGQADCILIREPSGKNMLIDAGNNEDSALVKNYLDNLGIAKLDIVIGTHPHEDHIGGLDYVINKFDIGKVYMPKVAHNTKTYKDVLLSIKNKSLKITSPKVGDTWQFGHGYITVLAPSKDGYEELNNYSIVLKLDYGTTSFIFTGDAEELSEDEMLQTTIDLKATVLKVGHHGSSSSTSSQFLKVVNPDYAVISCGSDNKYDHPHHETIQKLQEESIKIYRTDEVGTIIMTSDGKTIGVDKKASSIKENAPPVQEAEQEKEQPYGEINEKEQNYFSIVSITSPITKGSYATVAIKGVPKKQYDITVYYSSGPSKAKGLVPKTADSKGNVSWTWKVGTRTKPGNYSIVISGEGKTISTKFEVK